MGGVNPIIERQMLAPTSALRIAGEPLNYRLTDWAVTKSCTNPGGSCSAVLADKGADLAVEIGDELVLSLGYLGTGSPVKVFTGWVSEISRRPRFEIRALDDYFLQQAPLKVSLRHQTAAKITDYLLQQAQPGLQTGLLLLPTKPLPHFQGKQRTAKDLLRDLRATLIKRKWPINGKTYTEDVWPFWHIDREGKFSWFPWQDVTTTPFRFEYAKNISEFDPAEASEAERGLMRLTTFPHPWIEAGDTVIVDHPRLGAATRLRVDTHTMSKAGSTRTRSELFLSRLLEAA